MHIDGERRQQDKPLTVLAALAGVPTPAAFGVWLLCRELKSNVGVPLDLLRTGDDVRHEIESVASRRSSMSCCDSGTSSCSTAAKQRAVRARA